MCSFLVSVIFSGFVLFCFVLQKAGMMRADAARDAMRAFGFPERLINVCIKELLEVCSSVLFFTFLKS